MTDTLKAGREMDALIAERVFGVTETRRAVRTMNGPARRVSYNIPKYSTDIAAAWLVVEKMVADGWEITIEEAWSVTFSRRRGPFHVAHGQPNEAAIAICRSALEALGFSTEPR
jgi:hypothetical protein